MGRQEHNGRTALRIAALKRRADARALLQTGPSHGCGAAYLGGHAIEEIKRILTASFRKEFPEDTVDISDGYQENIHVLVVSRRFDGMEEQAKQDWLWHVIDSTDLDEQEKTLISLVYPVSPAQIK